METGEPAQARIWVQRRGAQAGQLFADFAGRPVCDAGGTVAGVLLYAADVTAHARDQKRLEALAGDLAASEGRYRTLFETMPQGIVHYGADGSILGANQAACEILGMDLAAVTSWPVVPEGQAVREDGSPFPPEDLPVRVALRTGEIVADTVAGVRHGRTGELRWVRITAVPDARDEQGRPSRAYVIDLTARHRAERERAALLARARANRAEADSARERLALLMRAGAMVAATRDRDELMDQVACLVVPALADYCVVFLPAADGMLRASSLSHRNRARAKVLATLREHPISPAGSLILQRAYTTGPTQLSRDAAAEMAAWASAEPDAISVVKLMRPRNAIATPLPGPHGPFGVIVLGRIQLRLAAAREVTIINLGHAYLGVGLTIDLGDEHLH